MTGSHRANTLSYGAAGEPWQRARENSLRGGCGFLASGCPRRPRQTGFEPSIGCERGATMPRLRAALLTLAVTVWLPAGFSYADTSVRHEPERDIAVPDTVSPA